MKLIPTILAATLAGALCAAACGGIDEPTDSETLAGADAGTPATDPTPSDQPDGASDAASAPTAAPVPRLLDPLPFERLVALLPAPAGWTRSRDRGHEVSLPVRQSVAEARYERNDVQVDLAIIDTGRSRVLLAPYEMFMSAGFEERASNGLTRALTMGGSPGFERWAQRPRSGEVVVVVARRYVVRASSTTAATLDPVTAIARGVDVGRLESMR